MVWSRLIAFLDGVIPAPVSSDRDNHTGAGCDLGVAGGELSVDGLVLSFDGDPSATRHGVPGIYDEVEDWVANSVGSICVGAQDRTKPHDHFDLSPIVRPRLSMSTISG